MIVISRKKLESEFKDELIEIPAKYLAEQDYYFTDETIPVLISSVKIENGISLNFQIKATQYYKCDRCLKKYDNKLDIISDFKFNYKNPDDKITEFMSIDESKDIDLTSKIIEMLNLTEPMKKLCKEDCVGLCYICGEDLNTKECDCKINNLGFLIEK